MKQIIFIIILSFLLFLLGFIGLSFLTNYGLTQYWEQKMQIIVELRDDIQETDLDELQNALESAPFVNVNTLDIITKDDAATLMRKEFGEEFLTAEIENPLRNVFIFSLNKNFNSDAQLEKIKTDLLQYKAVAEVDYDKNRSQNVTEQLKNLKYIGILIVLMILSIMAYLVQNHINLEWNDAKNEILAAEEREIALAISKKEGLSRSLKNGFWAAALAIAALIGYNYWFSTNFHDFVPFMNNNLVVGLFVAILIVTLVLIYIVMIFNQRKQKIEIY